MNESIESKRMLAITTAGKLAGMKYGKEMLNKPCSDDAKLGYAEPLQTLRTCKGMISVAEHEYSTAANNYVTALNEHKRTIYSSTQEQQEKIN